jgi:tetraprenyl-beta-curcumene synthase
MSMLGDRRLVARATLALAVANARYWPSVWPLVQRELRRWERRAREISHPDQRALALEKLRTECFNAEVAATLATLAPRAERPDAVEAIVALELLYDYLDGLTEQPSPDPLLAGDALFGAFRDAIDTNAGADQVDYLRRRPGTGDGGYLDDLSRATRDALRCLPAAEAVRDVAQRAAARCAQAQIRIHAAAQLGTEQLEAWARSEAANTGLQWRELAAGAASSVLAVHALIAAAADPRTTRQEAGEIEATYLSICVLITVLDSLVDHEEDMTADQPGFIRLYEDRDQLAQTLADVAQRAVGQAAALRDGPHHVMTLAGIVAYYTSAPGARGEVARPIAEELQAQLRPLITPTLAVMRSWRLAKSARQRWSRTGEHHAGTD